MKWDSDEINLECLRRRRYLNSQKSQLDEKLFCETQSSLSYAERKMKEARLCDYSGM